MLIKVAETWISPLSICYIKKYGDGAIIYFQGIATNSYGEIIRLSTGFPTKTPDQVAIEINNQFKPKDDGIC